MPQGTYTTTSTTSWFSRIGGSFKGIFSGIILFIIGIVVLFWNEGRTIRRTKALNSAQSQTITVNADAVDPANDGKAVCVAGMADTTDILADATTGISQKAIMLNRSVEYYQWQEEKSEKTEKKVGGKEEKVTTYSYEKRWVSRPIDSNTFTDPEAPQKYPNQVAITLNDEKWFAKNVTLGAFKLTDSIIRSIGGSKALPLAADTKLPESLKNARLEQNAIVISMNSTASTVINKVVEATQAAAANGEAAAQKPAEEAAQALTQNLESKQTVLAPQIGDVRITYTYIEPHDITIVGCQTQNTFCPITTKTGSVLEVKTGILSAEAVFASAQSSNSMLKWILRLVAFLLLKFGIGAVLAPFAVLADVLPFAGKIVRAGTGLISTLASAIVWLFVFAIAWIFYRPLLAIFLLVVMAALIVLAVTKLAAAKA